MHRKTDRNAVDAAAWDEAVAREAVIRPLIQKATIPAHELVSACRRLGVERTRLYELIERYRSEPVTSALVGRAPGPERGTLRLPAETEAVIAEALAGFYRSRQKPNVSALRKHLAPICRQRGVRLPCWSTLQTASRSGSSA
jgi:putative transposase